MKGDPFRLYPLPWRVRPTDFRCYGGLARLVVPCSATPEPPPLPFGWRRRKVPERLAFQYMPFWLALALNLWEARWAFFPWLRRVLRWSTPTETPLRAKIRLEIAAFERQAAALQRQADQHRAKLRGMR